MKKLSQKEILNEGFGSIVKSLARGAVQAAKGTAKMISPTAYGAAKSAADKVGGAIGNVLSSPTAAIKEYFNRPEIRSKYDELQIGKITKLNKYRSQIELEFRDVRTKEQFRTTAEAYRTDEGGFSPETWSFEKIKTPGGGVIGPDGGKQGGGKEPGPPPLVSPPSPGAPDKDGKDGKDGKDVKDGLKFYDELRDWKVKNIGPDAASVGINGHQMKEFLQSLGVKDPDRVIADRAGLNRVKYGTIVSNKQIATIETVLKSRGIVTESKKSQKSLLKHLQSMSR